MPLEGTAPIITPLGETIEVGVAAKDMYDNVCELTPADLSVSLRCEAETVPEASGLMQSEDRALIFRFQPSAAGSVKLEVRFGRACGVAQFAVVDASGA